MAIKAHGMTTKIDAETETITFHMIDSGGRPLVEHTLPLTAAFVIFELLLAEMVELDLIEELFEYEYDEIEVVGRC